MAIRVDLLLAKEKAKEKANDKADGLKKKTSVARRVTRRFRSTKKKARRARRCVPGAATRYAIGPGERNGACVTFATDC